MKKCHDCQYYDTEDREDKTYGDCRVKSPLIHTSTELGLKTHEGVWPRVSAYDWCGEFKPDERNNLKEAMQAD